MLKTTYECGAGSSDQAREVRTKGRLLVENYFNGPLTRFNNKSGLNAGTPLARGSDAMYTAALFNSDDRRVQYTGILGFHFSVDGELMPRPVVPNSFEDGPARVGVKLGGTLLFSGSQPGVAVPPDNEQAAHFCTALYASATTSGRVLSAVRPPLAITLAALGCNLAKSPLAVPNGLAVLEWPLATQAFFEWAEEEFAKSTIIIQSRVADEIRDFFDRRKRLGEPPQQVAF
jgi:hypothetical protein